MLRLTTHARNCKSSVNRSTFNCLVHKKHKFKLPANATVHTFLWIHLKSCKNELLNYEAYLLECESLIRICAVDSRFGQFQLIRLKKRYFFNTFTLPKHNISIVCSCLLSKKEVHVYIFLSNNCMVKRAYTLDSSDRYFLERDWTRQRTNPTFFLNLSCHYV